MKQYILSSIDFNQFKYLLTILDYETNMRTILNELRFEEGCNNCKILVDLVLKVGMGKYRFVQYPVLNDGLIDSTKAEYVSQEDLVEFETKINNILMNERKIVEKSTLSSSQKRKLCSN